MTPSFPWSLSFFILVEINTHKEGSQGKGREGKEGKERDREEAVLRRGKEQVCGVNGWMDGWMDGQSREQEIDRESREGISKIRKKQGTKKSDGQ